MSLARLLGQAISWGFTLFVIRILTPSDYGLMGKAVAIIALLQLLNEMGLGAAIIQKQDVPNSHLSTLFWLNLALSFTLYCLIFAAAPSVAHFLENDELTKLLRILGINLILGSMRTIQLNLLMKAMAFNKKSKAELTANICASITALVLAFLGFAVWSLVLSALVQNVVLTILFWYFHPWRPDWVFTVRQILELLRFGIKYLMSSLLWYASDATDILIVAKMLGEHLLGFYTVALTFSSKGVDLLSEIISQVSFPLYAMLQRDIVLFQRSFLRISRLIALVVFPVFVGLIVAADDLFGILLTEKWRPAVPVFQILCGAAIAKGLAFMLPRVLTAAGRVDLNFRLMLVSALVMPPAFLIGTRFGLIGVAVASFIVYPCLLAYALTLTLRIIQLPVRAYAHAIWPPIAATGFMLLLVLIFRLLITPEHPAFQLAGMSLIGVTSYLACMHWMVDLTAEFSFLPISLRRHTT